MVETVFSVLFLATLALPTLALAIGAIVLAWPAKPGFAVAGSELQVPSVRLVR